jgi:PAS domain S-box-containing protein
LFLSPADGVADIPRVSGTRKKIAMYERDYQVLFESSPLPMFVYDIKTLRFNLVNPAALLRYGYSTEELINRTVMDIYPLGDQARFHRRAAEVTPHGAIFPEEGWRHRTKDGEIFDVEISGLQFD